VIVRVTGQAPVQASVWELEKLRCNCCGEVFTAPAPEGIGEKEHLRPVVMPNGRRETRAAFRARLNEAERAELRAWREQHRWHPLQLRHAAGR
jgi:hypothetical protein